MTCITGPGNMPAAASRRRWKLIGMLPWRRERVVEPRERELVDRPALVLAQPQQQDLAQQVAQRVGRRVRVAMDLGRRVGSLEARVLDQELDRLADIDLAPMKPDVEDDPAARQIASVAT